ncbi:hypothetical protein VZT92_007867 [Zoarces viviparus]|uniref:VLIG-type G domain-containing protein n=1 Tax=Zoarces viviparus TaxID=48416 RepID=A0AAW1FLD0_ZOAVI
MEMENHDNAAAGRGSEVTSVPSGTNEKVEELEENAAETKVKFDLVNEPGEAPHSENNDESRGAEMIAFAETSLSNKKVIPELTLVLIGETNSIEIGSKNILIDHDEQRNVEHFSTKLGLMCDGNKGQKEQLEHKEERLESSLFQQSQTEDIEENATAIKVKCDTVTGPGDTVTGPGDVGNSKNDENTGESEITSVSSANNDKVYELEESAAKSECDPVKRPADVEHSKNDGNPGEESEITPVQSAATEKGAFNMDMSGDMDKKSLEFSEEINRKKQYQRETEALLDRLQLPDKHQQKLSPADFFKSATFGLEHIFREMGQIYEAHASLKKQPERGQTDWSKYPELAAELMISGHPMELMDGDAGQVPLTWISGLLDEVIKKLGDKRVFVLSVLGVQSSGKSTMLNAMFGLQFAVSAGRCTKGAFMQLVEVSEEIKKDFEFDYVLVVDTEGLRALELEGNATLHHDNELATFVVGLGNMTLINIFGENPAEMQDVLQIVVQAFMRMKKIKLSPSCVFVHQNVTDIAAAEKNMDGKRRLQEKLDKMTQLAAKEEVCDAECFSDIIAFDVQKDVKYFAQLWEGSPPMAPPNQGYSESVQELKTIILSKAKQSAGITLSQFKSKIQDLWNALMNEQFVFSFKNTLEIAVYRKLEVQYGNWTWTLRSNMLTIENGLYTKIENGKLEKEMSRLSLDKIKEFRMKPDQILIDQLCNCCWVKCPFCAAVCTNTIKDHKEDHSVPFHRSVAANGMHVKNSVELCIEFCTTSIASDGSFYPNQDSEVLIPYKTYRNAGPNFANWAIIPDGSKLEYWKWFVSRFEKELEDHYGLKFQDNGKIPSEWKKHSKKQALKSLDEMFKL